MIYFTEYFNTKFGLTLLLMGVLVLFWMIWFFKEQNK